MYKIWRKNLNKISKDLGLNLHDFKGKTYFHIRNIYVYVLLYAISIYYLYVLWVVSHVDMFIHVSMP